MSATVYPTKNVGGVIVFDIHFDDSTEHNKIKILNKYESLRDAINDSPQTCMSYVPRDENIGGTIVSMQVDRIVFIDSVSENLPPRGGG